MYENSDNMYRLVISLVVSMLLSSCIKHAKEINNCEMVDITFEQNYISNYDSLKLIDRTSLICLQENPEKDLQIKQIDKICVKNNHIYVADTYLKRLIVFDNKGLALYQVGSLGNGPGEYSSVADFYVADSCLYLYDSAKRKILVYNDKNKYLRDFDIKFNGEYFVRLTNGNFLFALAPYNDGKLKGKRFVITDSGFNVINTMFDFEEDVDLNCQMLLPFVECGDKIIYNRGISNNVYSFNKEGTPEQILYINFGESNVPVDELKDMNKFLASSNDYCYIASTPILTEDKMLTILKKGNELYTCIYDFKLDRPYLNNIKNYSTHTINLPFSITENNVIVSYFNNEIYPDYETDEYIPESVKKEIEAGAYIVCLYHLCR